MKKDIYLFGYHIPRFSNVIVLATESVAAVSIVCQLAISGNSGNDDEFKYPHPMPIVMQPSQYGITFKTPY